MKNKRNFAAAGKTGGEFPNQLEPGAPSIDLSAVLPPAAKLGKSAPQGADDMVDLEGQISNRSHLEPQWNPVDLTDMVNSEGLTSNLPHLEPRTPSVDPSDVLRKAQNSVSPRLKARTTWWAHQDSNLGPMDYESTALTN